MGIRRLNQQPSFALHPTAAQAIAEYIQQAKLSRGPLFRAQAGPRSQKLAKEAMDPATMYRVIMGYLERLPGAMKEHKEKDGTTVKRCIYTPHSLRAITATVLLSAGKDIREVQNLLGNRRITTT